MDKDNNSGKQARMIAQQAINILAEWAGSDFSKVSSAEDSDTIKRAKKLLGWTKGVEPDLLKLLFDHIHLFNREQSIRRSIEHYWLPIEIADKYPPVPYPVTVPPSSEQLDQLKTSIRETLTSLNDRDWEDLSFLMLILEKFGSFISLGDADIALIDLVRSTAAVAEALADDSHATHLSLIAGDLSGIQDFIYTISSDGALKSLRARSFYLELVTEEIVQQLLMRLNLPRTNVIYAGGGNLYLLASATEATQQAIQQVQNDFNEWLMREFQGKIFLALSHHEFPTEHIGNAQLSQHWQKVIKKQSQQKLRKFHTQISDLLAERESYDPTCKVCHRDDVERKDLQQLNSKESDSPLACPVCRKMFKLGDELFGVGSIIRSHRQDIKEPVDTIELKLGRRPSNWVYYHLFRGSQPVIQNPEKLEQSVTAFLINNWNLKDYRLPYFQKNVTPLLLGNYYQQVIDQESRQQRFIRAEEMAERAQGINRVGYLRMDIDRLGQIFAKGLGDRQTLPRLAGLSRQMSYFFKVYLNSLAADRQANLLDHPERFKYLKHGDPKQLERRDLLFIYAGGDDLFISGAWNQIVDFAFDIYQVFREYTGNHPEITLSGGITIAGEKYPLYQAAKKSEDAESNAKGNGKDSLGAFGEVFKWHQWLGSFDQSQLNGNGRHYIHAEPIPELFGVLPFVQALDAQLDVSQSRGFVRNLLLTAQLQSELVERAKQNQPDQAQAIRYYLHLPKVAYTLARLPQKVRDHPNFSAVRTSLKNPRNAPYFRAIATWIELLNRTEH